MENRESAWKFYSFGIVAVAKERGSDLITVTPIEEISLGQGLLNDVKVDYKVSVPDRQGVKRSDTVQGGAKVVAKWSAIGQSNRMTAPDVQPSETVMLYRVADTGEYYWTTLMREPGLRRLETVCTMYGNIPSGLTPFDKSTSYWEEWSTHDKYVHIHTSNNDGEPFEYDIKIDTAAGTILIDDNAGNNIFLESSPSKLTINTNQDIEFNTQRIKFNASESIEFNTPKYTLNATDSATVNTTTNELNTTSDTQNTTSTTVNASASIALSTAALSMDATTMSSTSGNMNMAADSVQLQGSGSTTISGPSINIQGGDITMTGGAITANGEDLNVDRT
jgi:hypothetical protein